ncbi:MAG: XrtV sorting system accessory protein [Alphaproteobacteria bacterium]
MSTVYDWVTVLIFIGLLALYFLRQDRTDVPIARYMIAAAGCALANYLGNENYTLAAVAVIAATLYFTWYFIVIPSESGRGRS